MSTIELATAAQKTNAYAFQEIADLFLLMDENAYKYHILQTSPELKMVIQMDKRSRDFLHRLLLTNNCVITVDDMKLLQAVTYDDDVKSCESYVYLHKVAMGTLNQRINIFKLYDGLSLEAVISCSSVQEICHQTLKHLLHVKFDCGDSINSAVCLKPHLEPIAKLCNEEHGAIRPIMITYAMMQKNFLEFHAHRQRELYSLRQREVKVREVKEREVKDIVVDRREARERKIAEFEKKIRNGEVRFGTDAYNKMYAEAIGSSIILAPFVDSKNDVPAVARAPVLAPAPAPAPAPAVAPAVAVPARDNLGRSLIVLLVLVFIFPLIIYFIFRLGKKIYRSLRR